MRSTCFGTAVSSGGGAAGREEVSKSALSGADGAPEAAGMNGGWALGLCPSKLATEPNTDTALGWGAGSGGAACDELPARGEAEPVVITAAEAEA
jgi:hypothetical protein